MRSLAVFRYILGNIFEKLDDLICRVEAWSTPEGLESCGAEGQINEDNPQVPSPSDVERSRKEKYKDIFRTPTPICGTPWLPLCEGSTSTASSGTRSNRRTCIWRTFCYKILCGYSHDFWPSAVQGEANSNFERDLYNCTFPTLIGDQLKLNQIFFLHSWHFIFQTPGGSSFPNQKHLLGFLNIL